ncbi:hypothetical protein DL764_001467 [Monosporascus ibericus]|uniref:Heterokaryon incompatibility domain-containing protein n=1 Tax=Monosporascus ibericus TaxID=155417 RepID=A0A4Q4TU71_9PEZI|nr:hypothetical protein DL764_001467 [Monosporascus ibericus]
MNPDFRYGVLDQAKEQIRLLKLLPSSPPPSPPPQDDTFCGCFPPVSRLIKRLLPPPPPPPSWSPPPEPYHGIDCEFLPPVSLSADGETVAYEALSYTWGDATSLLSIRLDKQNFNVTPNLHAALTALRHPSEPRTLWIDAICINQDDNDDKNYQVPLMGTIYMRATVVDIWLGPEESPTPSTNSVFDVLDKSSLSGNDEQPELKTTDGESVGIYTWKPRLAELKAFSERPYWTRIWVIQEVTLARRICVYCGSRQVQWDLLREHLRALEEDHNDQFSQIPEENGSSDPEREKLAVGFSDIFRGQCATLLKNGMSRGVEKNRRPLADLLHDYWRNACGDPRDKVYGLLSLASDVSGGVGGMPLRYGQPLAFVYLDVLHFALINRYGGVNWARLAALSHRMQRAFGPGPNGDVSHELHTSRHPQSQDANFIANKPFCVSLFKPSPIVEFGPALGEYRKDPGSFKLGLVFEHQVDEALQLAPWNTIRTLDYHVRGRGAEQQQPRVVFSYYYHVDRDQDDKEADPSLRRVLHPLDRPSQPVTIPETALGDADPSRSWDKYRLFSVQGLVGLVLGIITDQAKDGDYLAWLDGCYSAVVLRPETSGDRFVLVGRAVVCPDHGLDPRLNLVRPSDNPVLQCREVPLDVFQVVTNW